MYLFKPYFGERERIQWVSKRKWRALGVSFTFTSRTFLHISLQLNPKVTSTATWTNVQSLQRPPPISSQTTLTRYKQQSLPQLMKTAAPFIFQTKVPALLQRSLALRRLRIASDKGIAIGARNGVRSWGHAVRIQIESKENTPDSFSRGRMEHNFCVFRW